MAKAINNMDDLAIALQPVMKKMVATWANEGLHGGKNLASNAPHVWEKQW